LRRIRIGTVSLSRRGEFAACQPSHSSSFLFARRTIMKIHRKVRLRVEELENRLVPSAGTPWPYPTSNWSGYAIDTAVGAVSDVKGSWTVPTVNLVSGTNTTYYSASWIGIDGDLSNT